MTGMRIRRDYSGLFCSSLGLIEAFALVFFTSTPAVAVEKDDQFPSWKATRYILEGGLYLEESSWSLIDADDAGGDQSAVRSRPLADFFYQSRVFEHLAAVGNQSAPVPALTRLAPKRSPPPAPLFV